MLIKYGLKSLSFLFALWTQGMDAGYNLRLHACAGPNLAVLRSHSDLCDAYQTSFTYPTPMSAPKSASFPQPTRLQALKRAVCANRFIETDHLYIVHVNHFIESPQINPVYFCRTIQANRINIVYLTKLVESDQIHTVNASRFI